MPLKKHKITIESDSETLGIGISTPLKDYRLCFLLNREKGIDLKKNGVVRMLGKDGIKEISCYIYFDIENDTAIYLAKNRQEEFTILPEYKIADYLLLVKNSGNTEFLDEIKAACQRISNIQSTFALPTELLNHIEID
jgi:hypothetical protein